ncbi:TetR family transcriptional regulator [Sphaerisporangium krabiense]|uniref:AcrR family transcriptional regulator n=1 Tax=Sphaerisporangium krabiense TaxID=763782 RepID=A0A7W8Z9B3_9ACTN|nr:TetR/AcrR family transcriptional regulator [Sphaerisporangium krabiense]MBB5629851.1 AcrR family transcriptional regulator [Sphaerisporangium krabiense]GII63952.1 TetR family transcriptional regulator [Sphaerisporangium krabiense]
MTERLPAGDTSPLDTITSTPEAPRERSDAARNRARVLAAAERLFATTDARQVTMEDIARAAGVGRATLYRRYPDPASIAVALLDEHERRLQEHILRGEPPLGPGASPADRLAAFYAASADLLEDHLHLALGAEVGQARFAAGAYGFWRAHVRALLAEAGVPDPDAAADTALAPLAPDLYRFQRHTAGLTKERLVTSLAWLARRLTTT